MQNDSVERKLRMGWLLDFYGGFLTDRQQAFLDLHYNQDLSLAEIAEQEGISRQGVHDAIRRGETVLSEMEERLGLAGRFTAMSASLALLRDDIEAWKPSAPRDGARKEDWIARVGALLDALS